jgi:hypothetical protein
VPQRATYFTCRVAQRAGVVTQARHVGSCWVRHGPWLFGPYRALAGPNFTCHVLTHLTRPGSTGLYKVPRGCDAAVIFVNPDKEEIQAIWQINISKCAVYPSRSDTMLPFLCDVKDFTCKYLGVLLSIRNLKKRSPTSNRPCFR